MGCVKGVYGVCMEYVQGVYGMCMECVSGIHWVCIRFWILNEKCATSEDGVLTQAAQCSDVLKACNRENEPNKLDVSSFLIKSFNQKLADLEPSLAGRR